jgi:VanZ family protein
MGGFLGPLILSKERSARLSRIHSYYSRDSWFVMGAILRRSAIIFCLGVVLFFALKPGPEVPNALVPDKVRIYFNTHDALRNQLGFGLLSVAVLFSLTAKSFFNQRQVLAVVLIALLIPTLEFAQRWMPKRHVDFKDVLNGWLGLGGACVLYGIMWWIWRIATRSGSKN